MGAALVALALPSVAAAACPTSPLSPAALTGFEHGRHGYSADNLLSSGSTSITSAAARNGAYGVRVNAAGAPANQWFLWNEYGGDGVVRFAFKLDSLPAGDVRELFSMDTYSKSSTRIGYDAATQSLKLSVDSSSGGSASVAGPAVTAGAWHVVDVRYSTYGFHWTDWYVDGVQHPSAATSGPQEYLHYVRFGSTAADTFTASYDDVLISASDTDYPVGDGAVHVLRPNGSSATNGNLRDNDGTLVDAASWTRLDEIPATSTADFIQQTKASSTSYAQISFQDTAAACARAVRGYLTTHSQASNNANDAKLVFLDGAKESVVRAGDWAANNTRSRDYSDTVTPASAWSQAALNGLVARFGYSMDVKPVPILDGVLVEYEVPLP
ncbi:MAG TPA: hypothetical protein VHF89_10915 [Solirubrobacteraceae bacterium]|nr:hypothetical protein [Solirubrobacteraceae bacterium]